MASNIRVVLEVDNKKYIADIKAADRATEQFATNTKANLGGSGKGFDTLGRGIEVVSNKLINLKTAVLGVGFAALTRSALEFASSIKDLSDSSGIAVDNLLNLSAALTVSGVSAEKLPEVVSRFGASVEDAASNAGKSLFNFEKLGITLEDIGKLSQQALLEKTLEGLVRMGPGVERTARMMELFGKAGRTMDPESVLASMRGAGTGAGQYADNLKRAAELSDQLALAQQKLSVAITVAFGPAIEFLAEFAKNINNSKEALDAFVDTLKYIAAALATAFAATALLTFVRLIGTVGRGITAAGVAMGVFGEATRALFAPMGKILVIGRAIALLAGIGFGIYTASQLFDDFGDRAVNAMARAVEMAGTLAAAVAGGAFGAGVGSAIAGPAGTILGGIAGALAGGSAMEALVAQARKAREEAEAAARARKALQLPTPGQLDTTLPTPTGGQDQQGADISGALTRIRQQREEIQKIGREYSKNNQQIRDRIQLETDLVGKSSDYIEIERARAELADRTQSAIQQLEDRKSSLREEDQRLIPVINQQIEAIKRQSAAEDAALSNALRGRQLKEASDRIAIQNAKQVNDLENIRAQLLGYSLTELEKFNQAQRTGDFRNKTQEEIDQLKEQANARDKLIQALTVETTLRQTGARIMEIESSIMGRQFTELEKLEALKKQNPEAFERKTALETLALKEQAAALDDATKKFQALAFARDLQRQGEDFVAGLREQMKMDTAVSESARRRIQVEIDGRNQLQSKLREINDRYGDEMKLSEELRSRRRQEIDEATNGINNLIALKRKSIEEDQAQRDTFNFGWEQAFRKYAEDANSAADQAKTYFETFTRGFEDVIVRFVQTGKLSFKDLANTIIAEFARVQAKRLITGIFGGGGGGGGGFDFFGSFLSNLFGGFFADGGNPPIGKGILVGERGPEFMIPRNAATIVPNEGMTGQTRETVVTYNINAVDAASFQQLLARDPKFLHTVAEKGRRSLPQGVRQ